MFKEADKEAKSQQGTEVHLAMFDMQTQQTMTGNKHCEALQITPTIVIRGYRAQLNLLLLCSIPFCEKTRIKDS